MGATSLDIEPLDVREGGDLTVEYGRYRLGIEADGTSMVDLGKYIVVHRHATAKRRSSWTASTRTAAAGRLSTGGRSAASTSQTAAAGVQISLRTPGPPVWLLEAQGPTRADPSRREAAALSRWRQASMCRRADRHIVPALHDELTAYRADHPDVKPDDLVFPTSRGTARNKDNARERVVRPVVKRADELLAEPGRPQFPRGVTRTSCATPSPPSSTTRRGPADRHGPARTPTRRSRCASTPTQCAATRATTTASRRSSRAVIGHQWALAALTRPLLGHPPTSRSTTKSSS